MRIRGSAMDCIRLTYMDFSGPFPVTATTRSGKFGKSHVCSDSATSASKSIPKSSSLVQLVELFHKIMSIL